MRAKSTVQGRYLCIAFRNHFRLRLTPLMLELIDSNQDTTPHQATPSQHQEPMAQWYVLSFYTIQ